MADTRAHPELYRIAAHIPLFDDLYDAYPAHLHINLTSAARGHGLGGRLIAALEENLRSTGVPGLHLVTDPHARNVSFYRKNGFTHAVERPLTTSDGHTAPLLLLGKEL